ncbi:MAG TPA: peptidoglycan DD-metalloendopeptidase family protein [Acidimicrobiales bacterium]|nr:peptidoglycan DD-metalloendopeptidase family protein [Acidimicrobiales bacterium]
MPKTSRPTLVALFLALLMTVLSAAAPAGADTLSDAKRKREEARTRRAQLAAKINALEASDEELDRAVKTLNRQVLAQQASADAARQAVQAAVAAVAQADAELHATEAQIARLHKAVVDRAVAAYVRPQDDSLADLIASEDVNEATRRASLLSEVANRNSEVIDQLRAAREDLAEKQAKAQKARDVAAERRKAVLARLSEVQKAHSEKQRLSAALEARIAEYQREADEVAKTESGLTALIQQRQAARASRSAADPGTDGRVSGSGLIWPVRGPVTSGYGYRWGRMHQGIDIGAGSGVPIRAAKGGEVIFAGSMGGYGNCIVVDHGGGFTTLYAHQSRLGASDGQSVSQGQVIGYVGSTGHSTGPHLHFETRVDGSPRNPRNYLP